MSDRPALLVIADIGGYTAFVKQQRASLAHAQDIIGRLLEAMIDAVPELTLVEVAGLDVVLVHRMLKNGVPVPEYVLMSENLYEHGDDALRGQSVALPQEFEGLGKVQTYFLDIDGIALAPLPPPRRTAWAIFVENVGVLIRAFPYRFGFRKPRFALSARGKP